MKTFSFIPDFQGAPHVTVDLEKIESITTLFPNRNYRLRMVSGQEYDICAATHERLQRLMSKEEK